MADLPDWYTLVSEIEAEAYKIRGGADAAKSASPEARDVYLATDTLILYVCATEGVWTGFDASILVQGILTLYANLAGGGYEIENIADPTAAQSAATRAYVLAQVASYLALAGGTMSGPIAMDTNKITGLGDPTAAQDAATRAYVLAQKALCLLLAGGTMSGDIAMGGNKVTGLGAPSATNDALRYNQAEIRNAEIAAAAAIAYSKLNLTGLIRNADIKSDAAIAVSKLVNTYFPETLMTTQGDILVRGASNPERFAKPTTGQILETTATGYQGVAKPSPTKEFFVPITHGTAITRVDNHPVAVCNAQYEEGDIGFLVPHDFSSIIDAVVVVIPKATQASADWDIYTNYSANGEAVGTHSESDTASTYNVTDDEQFEIDISGCLSSLAAGDVVGVYIMQGTAAHNFNILGVRFKYS